MLCSPPAPAGSSAMRVYGASARPARRQDRAELRVERRPCDRRLCARAPPGRSPTARRGRATPPGARRPCRRRRRRTRSPRPSPCRPPSCRPAAPSSACGTAGRARGASSRRPRHAPLPGPSTRAHGEASSTTTSKPALGSEAVGVRRRRSIAAWPVQLQRQCVQGDGGLGEEPPCCEEDRRGAGVKRAVCAGDWNVSSWPRAKIVTVLSNFARCEPLSTAEPSVQQPRHAS